MIRWLDFNDTWLAAEWGHPSDNLGGILATADWLSRNAVASGKAPLTMKQVLTGMINTPRSIVGSWYKVARREEIMSWCGEKLS